MSVGTEGALRPVFGNFRQYSLVNAWSCDVVASLRILTWPVTGLSITLVVGNYILNSCNWAKDSIRGLQAASQLELFVDVAPCSLISISIIGIVNLPRKRCSTGRIGHFSKYLDCCSTVGFPLALALSKWMVWPWLFLYRFYLNKWCHMPHHIL